MALYHHDSRDYNVAASEAAKHARAKIEEKIELGRQQGANVIKHVMDVVPQDKIVHTRKLGFDIFDIAELSDERRGKLSFWDPARRRKDDPKFKSVEVGGIEYEIASDSRPVLALKTEKGEAAVHPHALRQMADKLGMSVQYMNKLFHCDPKDEEWRHALLLHNFTELASHTPKGTKNLVRLIHGAYTPHGAPEVRGFLSDKYRRLDSRPILDAFIGACRNRGAEPFEGVVSDTRVELKALLPYVFEPVPNEVCAIGVQFMNSDFGAGKLSIRVFMLRLWCTNKAITDEELGKVHLGSRLHQDIEFSERTYKLDTQANASAVKDIVNDLLGPQKVDERLNLIKLANEKQIKSFTSIASLAKALTKEEYEAVKAAYESEDEYNLPPGKTAWRLSNALSWVAHKAEGSARRQELGQLAGDWLTKAA